MAEITTLLKVSTLLLSTHSWVTIRSRTSVSFDKMGVFCDKFCVSNGKYVFIIVKIKFMNFDNMSDICGKLDFTIDYIYFTTIDKYFIKKHRFYNF
jgi:hypothetical protein